MQISTKSTTAKLIGLTGFAGAGKDSFADHLVRELDYVKVGFADKLYELALKLDPIVWKFPFPQRLSKIVAKLGWTKAKRIKRVRKYLQWLGTEVCRDTFGPDFWVKTMDPVISGLLRDGKSVVITNCRFKNEAEYIETLGGSIVSVRRHGVGPVNNHVSDQGEAFEFSVFDVVNDRTEEDLKQWAYACHAAIHGTHPNPLRNLPPFEAAVHRALASGIELVLQIAAPASVEAQKWRERHRLEVAASTEDILVLVDGEAAGKVSYNDNVVAVEAKIAR
jgi:hypothetical protein